MSYLNKRLKKELEDPKFRKEWEESEIEYLIANKIIYFRKEKNMTQSDLANALDTKQSVISRIENANENLSINRIKSIAKALGIHPLELLPSKEHKEQLLVSEKKEPYGE